MFGDSGSYNGYDYVDVGIICDGDGDDNYNGNDYVDCGSSDGDGDDDYNGDDFDNGKDGDDNYDNSKGVLMLILCITIAVNGKSNQVFSFIKIK